MRAVLPSKRDDGKRRWPRGQKFTPTASGDEAEAAYREAVLGARASGRTALEAALAAWAVPRLVAPGDGVVLCELSGKRLGLPQLVDALATSGIERDEVRGALDRLLTAGFVALVPLASQLAAT
jgi:hypothetical protein